MCRNNLKKSKVLFLGASFSQVPIIKFAKKLNLHIITVDYLPNNPGHKYADEYYNISTIEKEKILELAKNLDIDAISAYASDPSALTAAYVSEKLGLVGNSVETVEILSNKSYFRKFLKDNNFLTPTFLTSKTVSGLVDNYSKGKYVIKPAYSSGSKGVRIVENKQEITKHFNEAMAYSLNNEVILESYISKKGPQIHGEGFVENGNLTFLYLGDQYFSNVNQVAPFSTIVPSIEHQDIMPKIKEKLKILIKKVCFINGGINIEIIRSEKDEIYILEIGARNGGNFMPQLIEFATGFRLAEANLKILFNQPVPNITKVKTLSHFAQVILHSEHSGVFEEICLPTELKNNVVEEFIYYKKGDNINVYKSSKDVVGVLILELKNKSEVDIYINSLKNHEWVKIRTKNTISIKKTSLNPEILVTYFQNNHAIFEPPLDRRVSIEDYANKLCQHAEFFCLKKNDNILGMMACYINDDKDEIAFISSISIIKDFQNQGLGGKLLNTGIEYIKRLNYKKIRLQVYSLNNKAITFYKKHGFIKIDNEQKGNDFFLFELDLNNDNNFN